MRNICIKNYELDAELFDRLLEDYSYWIQIVDTVDGLIHGYPEKNVICYDGREYLICPEYVVNGYTNSMKITNEWKQCRVRRVENCNSTIKKVITGTYAWNYMMRLLKKYYSDEEILDIFSSYSRNYSDYYKQVHYYFPLDEGELLKFNDCYKYDINGAHTDAILEMFPKAAKAILNMYEHRHEDNNYKEIVNYFVGMLKHYGYEKTYNWIVQRTTKLLLDAIDKTDGILLYANTDGFVVADPEHKIDKSKELGKFKLEYQGECYTYRDKNYWIIQSGDEIKGSCLKSVRSHIDLRVGKVVHYKRVRKLLGVYDGEPNYLNTAEDVQEEIINEN